MHAYIQYGAGAGPFLTERVEIKTKPLWWQQRGLSFTATGYGARIPTAHMVRLNGRWRRVYCAIWSNIGTLYIGRRGHDALTVQIEGA